jgi:hypothetical protein
MKANKIFKKPWKAKTLGGILEKSRQKRLPRYFIVESCSGPANTVPIGFAGQKRTGDEGRFLQIG